MNDKNLEGGFVFVAALKYQHGCKGLSEKGYDWFNKVGCINIRKCFQNNYGFSLITNFAAIFNEKVQQNENDH